MFHTETPGAVMKFRALIAGILIAGILIVSMGTSAHSAVLAETPFFQSSSPPGPANIYPNAWDYNGRTYVAFQHTSFDPYIMSYNHSTGAWSAAVKVGTNPLGDDAHGAPALWIDNNGFLHVYYGSHGGALKHAKSNSPEDVSSWTAQPDAAARNTYPQLSTSPSGVMLSYRAGTHEADGSAHDPWGYKISTDSGNTFGSFVQVTKTGSGGDLYAGFKTAPNGDIHAFITNRSGSFPNNGREDVYHIYKKPNGNWFSANGTSITVPIDLATLNSSGAKIYDTGGVDTVGVVSIAFDSTGTLLIGFSAVGDGTFKSGKKTVSGSWSFSTIGGSANHWKDIAAIERDGSTFYAYITHNGAEGAGEIDRYKSTNGGASWTKVADLTTGNTFINPQKTIGNNSNARVVFFDATNKIYLWGDSGYLN